VWRFCKHDCRSGEPGRGIERELEALASTVEIVRTRARDLYGRVVTSEEELAALLERIRHAAQEALSQGKHFTLS